MKAKDLNQDKKNYRKHSDENKRKIKKSIDEAGFGRSVVIDADGVLVCGNGVHSVIDGNTPVKVVETDGTELVVVKRTDLHEGDDRRKLLALADNATADNVEWDVEMLQEEWDDATLEEWVDSVDWKDEVEEAKEAQEDDFDEDKDEVATICKNGDIWQLGQHRLMCGDSTDAGSVALLMDGEKADMVFTDPPYGVSYTDKNEYLNSLGKPIACPKAIENDSKKPSEMYDFWKVCFENLHQFTNDKMAYYITAPQGGDLLLLLLQAVSDAGFMLKHQLIWNKNNHVLGRCDYNYKHEPIIYGWKIGGTHNFVGAGKFKTSVWDIPKPLKNDLHPTMKPIELISECLLDNSIENDSVIDLFGGSGSTMIACEQLNRKCCMMELDEHYCDVIIARWEKLTGKKAVKVCNVNEPK